jgi:hypothetical protein
MFWIILMIFSKLDVLGWLAELTAGLPARSPRPLPHTPPAAHYDRGHHDACHHQLNLKHQLRGAFERPS